MKKIIIYLLFALFFVSANVSAADKDEAEGILKLNMDKIIGILKNNGLTKEQKHAEVVKIVTPIFDFSLMSKLAMGKKYWVSLSATQKSEYVNIFSNRLRQAYMEKLDLYSDEKIVYKPSKVVNKKVYIPTDLVSADKSISMLYKFYRKKAGWKIYDVEIQGISIIKNYRSQISQILQTGTIEDLLLKLKDAL